VPGLTPTVRNALVYAHTTALVLLADTHTTIVAINPALAHALGTTAAALQGVRLPALVHPDDQLTLRRQDVPARSAGSAPAIYRVRHHDGTWPLVGHAAPARHAPGRDVSGPYGRTNSSTSA
jgi:PAS domain-containing protein